MHAGGGFGVQCFIGSGKSLESFGQQTFCVNYSANDRFEILPGCLSQIEGQNFGLSLG